MIAAALIAACMAGCSGRNIDTALNKALYMNGACSGPLIANLHQITANTKIPTISSGVMGGSISRLAVTDAGIYTAYLTGGGTTEDEAYTFGLFRLAPESDRWEKLGTGQCYTDTVITLAGTDGRIYVVTMNMKNVYVDTTVYVYDAHNNSFLPYYCDNGKLQDFLERQQISAAIDKNGKISILLCGGSSSGYFDYIYFDTAKMKFGTYSRMRIDYPYEYLYVHANNSGSVEIIAERDVLSFFAGYQPLTDGTIGYVFDGIRYWRYANPSTAKPKNDISVRQENPKEYTDKMISYPSVINNSTGDAYWSKNGDLHILYTVSAISNGMQNETWHAVISNGKLRYNEKLWDGATSLRMIQDRGGNYYLLKMAYDSTALKLYKSASDDGRNFTELGEFDLSHCGALQLTGLYVAKPEGGTPLKDSVDVIYPSMNKDTGITEQWNYFRLYLK